MAQRKKPAHKVVMTEGKSQKDILSIDQKIILIYAKGLGSRQFSLETGRESIIKSMYYVIFYILIFDNSYTLLLVF